jgi:hypothetical protein
VRASVAGLLLAGLLAAPLLLAGRAGIPAEALAPAALAGFADAVDAVGWVLVPQLALAVAVLGLALRRLTWRAAGFGAWTTPTWIEPAVESALLLGMLGTLSGMVRGFVGLSPDAIEAGPLVHALGVALRSSFVGFGIALVGVWLKERPLGEAV